MSTLVTGLHLVSVSVQVTSGDSRMTVHPTSVTISGVTMSGRALHFLIQQFLIPRYPKAVIDRPFALAPQIREIRVTKGCATVIAR